MSDHDPLDDWNDLSVRTDAPDPDPAAVSAGPPGPPGEPPRPPGEYVEYRPPMSRRRRLAIAGAAVAATLLVVLGGLWMWLQRTIDPPGPPGEPIELEVASGSTTEDIGRLLEDNGVISSASIWNYWTRFNDAGPFQAGLYTFFDNSSFDEAVDVLEAGPRPPETYRVTIPEGLTVTEIVERLADPVDGVPGFTVAELEAALAVGDIRSTFQPADTTSMEGLLFPDTYAIDDRTAEAAFLQRLVTQMDDTLVELGVIEGSAALGVTPYEIVIIASLIEEEAKIDEDRPKIARVIYNRLAQGIPLGIDATNRYEAVINGRDREDLDFESDSPYNTRRIPGLPPTPIAAPGRASLQAALAPVDGPWIFYVLQTPTEHFFTESAAEFERAKAECARNNLGCG